MTGDTVTRVWVLDFSAEGPEPGDYTGHQSVHAALQGASGRLYTLLLEHAGLDLFDLPRECIVSSATAEDGSYVADLEHAGIEISYGVHNMPVEA